MSYPVTRSTGASRYSNASSTTLATTSAPNPAVIGASCTTTTRPVLRAEAISAFRSRGTRHRRSSTSSDTPSSAAASAAWRQRGTMPPQVTSVPCSPSRSTRARPIGRPFGSSSPDSFDQYRLFGSRKITGSGSRIEDSRRLNASMGVGEITWSSAGYENPSNWISGTGRHPARASPTEMPTIPDSASGVSNTRSSPNSACSLSVIRNTPPSVPTSSPKISTRSSSASARRSAPLRACAIVTSATGALLLAFERRHDLVALTRQVRRKLGERPLEDLPGVPGRRFHDSGADLRGELAGVVLDLLHEGVVDGALGLQVLAEPEQGVEAPPLLDLLLGLVPAAVVGGGVWAHPVRHGLDQGRCAVRPGPLRGLAGGPVDREHVVAVDPDPREAVPLGLPVDLPGGLPGQGDRDRPPVVLAEEDHRRLEHPGEVACLVEVSLGRGAVAEVHDGASAATVLPRSHGPSHRVERVGGDRDRHLGEPAVNRVVDPAVPRAPVKVCVFDEIDPPDDGHTDLPVGGEHEVLLAERVRAPDLGGLLPQEGRVHRQLALSLERRALQVDLPGQGHGPVHGPEVLFLQVEGLASLPIDHGPAGVQDPSELVVSWGHVASSARVPGREDYRRRARRGREADEASGGTARTLVKWDNARGGGGSGPTHITRRRS